jgi:hypothetical protein
VLRAHAAAVAEFRRLVPGGRISMNINGDWAEPYTQSEADKVQQPVTRVLQPCSIGKVPARRQRFAAQYTA